MTSTPLELANMHCAVLANDLDKLQSENEQLRTALSDAADALELANSLLRQKPITFAIPLTNQFNARHAAAERARDALSQKEPRHDARSDGAGYT